MSVSDHELMKAIVQQDAEAFETVARRHGETLRRLLIRMTRDESAADDLLQETLVRIWENAGQWKGQGSLGNWLRRIAINLALNHMEKVNRRKEQPLQIERQREDGFDDGDDACAWTPRWLIDTHCRPDTEVERWERQQLIKNALDALPPEKRTVFRMVYRENMDRSLVAETLGIPEGTVKSRLHYVMKNLMERWKDFDQDDA